MALDLVDVPEIERSGSPTHSCNCIGDKDIVIKISSPVYINFDEVHAKLLKDTVSNLHECAQFVQAHYS